jgi:superfamily II DNA/RNA helicase
MSLLGKEVLSNLPKLGVSSLTEFQSQAITRVLSNKNTVLLSPPGSGKTLSYLLSIASFCSQSKRPDSDDFSISSLFKDPIKTPIFPRPHGSLVIVPTHERLSEVYKKLRILAPWLSVKRASCTLASIVGTFGKTPDDFSNDHEYDEEGFKNIVRGCNWNKTDVVITTPANLHELAGFQRQLKIPHLNPALVVVDEIDWILE